MKPAIEHVERPELPWRRAEQRLTECGLVAASYPTITRIEFGKRLKEWGQQRVAMTTCMTCYQTAFHWCGWDQDPFHGIERAMRGEHRYIRPGFDVVNAHVAPSTPLRAELRAMALLVERHRGEFDALVTGLKQAVNLDEKREAKKLARELHKDRPKW